MLTSKYLTQDGLETYFKECRRLGFNYIFYHVDKGCYILSKQIPVFNDETFVCCTGEQHVLISYFSEVVLKDLLQDKKFIRISDHIDTVDWSKVPVDTKVIVSNEEDGVQFCRYFSDYKNGKVFTWDFGATSWSSLAKEQSHWNYARLAEDINE